MSLWANIHSLTQSSYPINLLTTLSFPLNRKHTNTYINTCLLTPTLSSPLFPSKQGQAEDIRVEASQIMRIRNNLVKMYSLMTGQTTDQITLDLDRDNFMSAEEALKYVALGWGVHASAD